MALEKIRDKSPDISEVTRHVKKRGKRKRFAIERRFTGELPKAGILRKFYEEEQSWHVYRRYVSEKGRDSAIAVMSAKEGKRSYEYRIAD